MPIPTVDKSAEIDATLSYFNFINGAFRIDIGQYPDPGDSKAAGLFFVAPFDGTVDRVDFSLLNGSDPGIKGSGTLRIKMVPSAQIISPASPGIDSLDVNFSQLMAENGFPNTSNFVNQIDLTSRNFEVVEGMEYFFQFSLVNESSTASLSFAFDGGVSDTTLATHFPARSFIWVELDSGDEYVSLRDPDNTDFRNLNLVTALQLSRPPPPEMTQLQVLNNAPEEGAIDVYLNDTRIIDDLGFQEATTLQSVVAGTGTLAIVAGAAPCTRAARWTAMPRRVLPSISHSPVWMPARISSCWRAAAARTARAASMARAGESMGAKTPSRAVSTSVPL
jgi:hypothetical protein